MADLYNPLTYDNLMAGLTLHFQQYSRQHLAKIDLQSDGDRWR